MISRARSRFQHHHQCTGPHGSCSCSRFDGLSSPTTCACSDSSGTAVATADSRSKAPCLTATAISASSASASTSATATVSQSADSSRARGEVDKEGTRFPSSDLSSSPSSHYNVYPETNQGDNDISAICTVSDSETGLVPAPVSAEENTWGISANGTGCLPAHPPVPLAHADTDTYTSALASTVGISASFGSSTPRPTLASDMSVGSSDTSTASVAARVPTAMVEYERSTYNYHRAHTTASVPAPSQTTPTAPSTLTPTRSHHSIDAQSSSRIEAKGDSDLCAESSSATSSRIEAPSWNGNVTDSETRSGPETPAALDTPAFRTPLGVYNGFVNGHRNDKDGYFPSSSSASSVISAASVQLQEQLHDEPKKQVWMQKRPQLRHFPSLARGVEVRATRPKQALSLLSLPEELVAHILRMGYFSPPGPAKASSTSNSTSTSPDPSVSPSGSAASYLFTGTNSAIGQAGARSGYGEHDSFWSTDSDTQHEDEAGHLHEHEHAHEHEDDNPPTITCDPHLRLALLHTCRTLRIAVFADPALWSVVRLGPGDGDGGVRRALSASPFPDLHAGAEATGIKGRERTYLGHQLALARAHPLRISLTAFWARSEVVEEREVDTSEHVFALLAGARTALGALDHAREEGRTKQWEAFELVCPREDEWGLLARATAHRAFPNLKYLSLTFVGRSSGSAIPMPVSTSISTTRRQAAYVQRERRARDGRPGARHSVALPSGSFGGWQAGALPALKGLLLRGVDLEGVVEDVLEHEYEDQDENDSGNDLELDNSLKEDVFNANIYAHDPPEPALPSLRALDIRGHGLWPEVNALDAFFTRHARGLRRLSVHVRSRDVLRDVLGLDVDVDGSSLVSTSTLPLRIPSLRVLEVDTSEGLNRDTARMVRLLVDAAVSDGYNDLSHMRKVVVKESGSVEGEELLRWSVLRRPQSCTWTAAKSEALLAITNSAISSALSALPSVILRHVGVLRLDLPAGEGGWGESRRLREMLAIFGNEEGDAKSQPQTRTDEVVLGRLRRVEVRNADVLGVVREVLAQPQFSVAPGDAEHDAEGEDEDEDCWERSLSSTGMAEPLCAAQELVISFSNAGSGDRHQEDSWLCKPIVAFISLFCGTLSTGRPSNQPTPLSLMACPSTSTSTYVSLRRLILKGPTRAQVRAVLSSWDGGNVKRMTFDGLQIWVQDIRL